MMPLLAGLFVFAGLLAAAVARARLDSRRVRNLREALELDAIGPAQVTDPQRTSSLLARSGLLAERALGDSRLSWAGRVLERSDWALSSGEFAVVTGSVTVVAGAFGYLAGGFLLGLFFAIVAACAPYAAAVRSVARRRRAFDEQFPALLDLLAGSLESGASVAQALQLVVEEVDEPAASEFGRVLAATKMGVPLGEALTAAADRIGSTDLAWTVQAIVVQQRTGGRLADVLRIVAGTMRNRFELQRELHALTAEGRLSAYILGGLPFGLAALLLVINPHYLNPLFHDPIGYLLVGGAGALMLVAFAWMSRIVKVEV